MNGTSRRRADSDPNLSFAKTFRLAKASFGRKSSGAAPPPGASEAKSRHGEFVYSQGSKLHSFTQEEAPWPFAYNREVLELCGLDHSLVIWGKGNQIFSDFQGASPKRCLDLGTAMGDWVVDTARHLPDCTFVGFDLVDIQIPLQYIPPELADRIEWVHGNFLECPLPFRDNEFDLIHAEGIALGVPENKWDQLFGELNRILVPGGRIELLQQDARFPVLPRWFTEPLHAHLQHFPAGPPDDSRSPYLASPVSEELPHAYVLLEELYFSIFESRSINPTPTSILPANFNTAFRHVLSPPILHFPSPPLAPLAPFPKCTTPSSFPTETSSNPNDIGQYFVPSAANADFVHPPSPLSITTKLSQVAQSVPASPTALSPPGSQSTPTSPRLQRASSIVSLDLATRSRSPSSSARATPATSRSPSVGRSAAVLNTANTTRIGGEDTADLFKIDRLMMLGNETLFMHLYIAVGKVLGAREAMWGELVKRVEARDAALARYGWGAEDYELQQSRAKFDALVRQYERDMHVRLSLWNSLVKSGWTYPRRGQMTDAELHQEEDLRRAIIEARKNAREEDFSTPSRSIRLLIGVKGT
ncbi:hypothetical protein PHLGIDRAFT_127310 [Phlebiopsis gigantea 11061_1 CR5-6]|uniref:Methyltransferase domain-containing protein n=1 Tax=Phlebiopsis gigantea (strain 11061_1 CR5-6) TaxID=745531 RepID=A0A0C3RZS5_PHLG1|nr:hypothetical protein PHLGIDRAFT_127310 [Phlebiopsis gigantea 11061_1 CR5-6]